jgi:hypothetical protein
MEFEFNSIQIQLITNYMQIGGEGISKSSCEYGVGKKNFKKT